uniref:Sorting nexin 1a n=1 Tax=Acanthochromis polyacanthus TaxID=80966 RepID=A0A3Q1GVR7_9TELE
MSDPLIEPISSQTENKPASEAVNEPSDDFVDLTNNISATTESAVAEIPLDEPSDDFVDILGSETEAQREEVVVTDVTVEAAADKSEVTSGVTDSPGDGKIRSDAEEEAQETSAAPIIDLGADLPASNTQQLPVSDKIADPLVDLLGDPSPAPAADAKKPSGATIDLFEDEGSDLFGEPRQTKSAKQQQKSLFGEADEDLFGEPLGAVSKKPVSKEQKEKSVTTKAAAAVPAGGPLLDSSPAEPADIFTEEAVTTTPSVSNTSTVNSKTNGVHSEEEADIFSGGGKHCAFQTTLPMFRNKTFTVRRRFSDFLGLYEKLSEKHGPNGFIVPPPPEKSILGMTKVKVGKEDSSSADFVERRRGCLYMYLQRVVNHPSLIQDPDVREFLEREDLPRAVSTQALSGAGFLKMINKATDAVSKMTIKMNESDVWFEEKLQEVESADQQFRKLHALVESLVIHRKELSLNTASFAKSTAMLGSAEDNTALSRALSQLAEVEDKMEQLHQDQAANDTFSFAELIADYIRLLGAVRGSFDHRMKVWQRWQDAQAMLQKKRETEAKLLWANKPDKLQLAKEEIAEWEAKVTQYERDFERVSATVRKEVVRFEKEKTKNFKRQIIKYLESLLQSQQQLIKYWEAFLPEAKAIA